MPTDKDIRRLHVVDGWSKENIADMLGHTLSSIRGRISRASLQERVDIAREIAEMQPLTNEGIERQNAIIRRGEARFEAHQDFLRERGTLATGVFAADMHLPYANWPAVKLYLKLLEVINPDYISGANDRNDHTGYGRWGDSRPPARRLWEDDVERGILLNAEVYDAEQKAAPNALILQVQGNHDNWITEHLRKVAANGFSERNIADLMAAYEEMGLVQFTSGRDKKENIVRLSPGLKWVHGVSAASNDNSVARATLEFARGRDEEDGIYYNTVSGHVHRSFEKVMFGVWHWNAGTLGTQDPDYMKHLPRWDASIVVNRFDPNSRFVTGEIIRFRRYKGHLIARFDGVEYDVPLSE